MANPERSCPHVKDEGFTELYPQGTIDANGITADIIFVHGLMGHPRKTWQCGKTPKETNSRTHTLRFWRNKDTAGQSRHDQATSNGVCYWPFDLLRLDVKNVRILTYGYDSHPSHFCTGPTNSMTISQHAENFLKKIVDIRSGHLTRPVIFVAHGLGGILVKDAIVESRKFSQNVRMRQVYEQCRAIFFFGTPHSGATLAEWGLLLSNILGSIPGPDTYKRILRELSPDSEKLEMVTKDFNDVLDADVPKSKKIMICSLCEGKGMSGLNVLHGQVGSGSSFQPFALLKHLLPRLYQHTRRPLGVGTLKSVCSFRKTTCTCANLSQCLTQAMKVSRAPYWHIWMIFSRRKHEWKTSAAKGNMLNKRRRSSL